MTIAKDQHFLPQFYLRQFVDPDTPPDMEPYVWLYDLAERRWRRRAPKNVAALRHYYAYRDKDKQLVNVIEPHLADVESLGATLIRKLASRTPLTEREQLHFSLFIAQLAVRTPQSRFITELFLERKGRDVIAAMIRRWRENPKEFEASQHKYRDRTGKNADFSIDDFEKHAPRLVPNDVGLLAYSMIPSIGLTERLMGMTWRIYFTQPEHRLVICDHPCEVAFPDEITEETFRGFLTEDIEFHVPLTPNMIFTAYDDGLSRAFGGFLGCEDVVSLNRRMAKRAERFLVSPKSLFLGDDVLLNSNASAVEV